jgi:hypothetical protein
MGKKMRRKVGVFDARCIGYLGHPFVKEAPWNFTARLFLVVRWDSAIERAGDGSHIPEKTGGEV